MSKKSRKSRNLKELHSQTEFVYSQDMIPDYIQSQLSELGITPDPKSGKARSELVETRIRDVMGWEKPDTTNYDFLVSGETLELKQTEAYLSQPKFQQVKPYLYSYMLFMANYRDKSCWYFMSTKYISKTPGKENAEVGKLTMSNQHQDVKTMGQINLSAQFYDFAILLGEYPPVKYENSSDLNMSDDMVRQLFEKIENEINKEVK